MEIILVAFGIITIIAIAKIVETVIHMVDEAKGDKDDNQRNRDK